MRRKIFCFFLLACFFCLQARSEIITVDEISLPITAYKDKETGQVEILSPQGELVVELRYADSWDDPDMNNYSIHFRGYSDKSRQQRSSIFNSHLSGISPKDVRKNAWGKSTYRERTNINEMKHYVSFSNGIWETRISYNDSGNIVLSYGRLLPDGSLDSTYAITLAGGDSNWDKLLKFLRKAHSHYIGKDI